MTRNIARDVEKPKGIQPADREPYTEEEMVAMLNACDVIGQRPYERLRARAMVLLMRYTGLSIRNTFLLRGDQIHDGYLEVRRAKNGKPIHVPVMLDLEAALNANRKSETTSVRGGCRRPRSARAGPPCDP